MRPISNDTVLIIAGPTASGKSSLAIKAAEKFDGVIINSDAMQVYSELRILTARPSKYDESIVPHKLYGTLPATKNCSVALWKELAETEILACWQKGVLPIIAGGTGLYIKALMQGLSEIPQVSGEIREEVISRRNKKGAEAFHDELRRFDPKTALKVDLNDTQRMVRAYEVYLGTNRSLSDWQESKPTKAPFKANYQIVILDPPRDKLYKKCDHRFNWMIKNGAIDEVKGLLSLNLEPTLSAMKAIGVAQLTSYLSHEQTLDIAVSEAQKMTRRYAKRQLTWFRNQIIQCYRVNEQYSERLSDEIFSKIVI